MNHVVIGKTAHHVHGGVGFTDVGQELVTQAFAFGSTRDQTGDVYKFHHGRQNALGVHDLGQILQTLVRNFDHTDVRFDGAEGVVFSRNAGFGQSVEQSGFTNVGQANDAALQCHEYPENQRVI